MFPGRRGFVYVIDRGDGAIKIGMTRYPEDRIKSVQVQFNFIAFGSYVTDELGNYTKVEIAAHKMLDRYRVNGEWFRCDIEIGKQAVIEAICILQTEIDHVKKVKGL